MGYRGRPAMRRGFPASEPLTLAALAVPLAFAAIVAALAVRKVSHP